MLAAKLSRSRISGRIECCNDASSGVVPQPLEVSVNIRINGRMRLCRQSGRSAEAGWRVEKLEFDPGQARECWQPHTSWMSEADALAYLQEQQAPISVVGHFAGYTLQYPQWTQSREADRCVDLSPA